MHIVMTQTLDGLVKILTVFGSAYIRLLRCVIVKSCGVLSHCTSKATTKSDPDTLENFQHMNLLRCLCSAALGRVNAVGG